MEYIVFMLVSVALLSRKVVYIWVLWLCIMNSVRRKRLNGTGFITL